MNATLKAGCSHSLMLDEQMEAHLLDLLKQLVIPSAWGVKEKCLQQLAPLINQQPNELQEALLLAGPTTVLDSILAVIVSQRTELSSKLLAADVLSEVCSSCSKACLLLCPSNLVERLMRCASKGDGDMKAAAARALWQLSCHHDFSPEVSNHRWCTCTGHAMICCAATEDTSVWTIKSQQRMCFLVGCGCLTSSVSCRHLRLPRPCGTASRCLTALQ